MIEYLNGKEVFVFDGFAGADSKYTRKIRVINEKAWAKPVHPQLADCPTEEQLEEYGEADFTILAVPGVQMRCEEVRHSFGSGDYHRLRGALCHHCRNQLWGRD